MKSKYLEAFLDMAERFGKTSEATRLKVGALIVRDGRVLSCGCNGQPPGWSTEHCEDEHGNTLPTVRHAEVAALEKLWNSPESAIGATMFVSHSPCLLCAIKIKTAGIREVVYRNDFRTIDGLHHLKENGVIITKL